jgi:hypothetical protein
VHVLQPGARAPVDVLLDVPMLLVRHLMLDVVAQAGLEIGLQVGVEGSVELVARCCLVELLLGGLGAELVFEGALGVGHGFAEVLFGA